MLLSHKLRLFLQMMANRTLVILLGVSRQSRLLMGNVKITTLARSHANFQHKHIFMFFFSEIIGMEMGFYVK